MKLYRRTLFGAAALALLAASTGHAQNADGPQASPAVSADQASATQTQRSDSYYAAPADGGSLMTNGPYIGIEGGGNFVQPISPHGGPSDGATSHYEDSYVGGATLGYGFGNGIRAEIEGDYRRNDVHSTKNIGTPSGPSGALGMYTVMLNGIYDLDLSQFGVPTLGFTPHIGVGAGWAQPRFDHAGYYNGSTVSGKDDLFAYQGIVGVDYAVTPNIKVNLDYHYLGTTVGHFDGTSVATGASSVTKSSITDQSVILGVRYELNDVAPPSPPPPPPPPPPPQPEAAAPAAPQPEAHRNFQVFFDFDKSTISDSARQIIQEASAVAKAGGHVNLRVTGHTDTVGSARYNLRLSQRRAASVKRELIADGVSSGEIMTLGVGKTDLLVPTPDQVREPQNRRATIEFDNASSPSS